MGKTRPIPTDLFDEEESKVPTDLFDEEPATELKKKDQAGGGLKPLSPYVSAPQSISAEKDFTGFIEQSLKEKPKQPDMTTAEATEISRRISGYQPPATPATPEQLQEQKINDYLTIQSGGDPEQLEKLKKGVLPGGITNTEKPGDEEFNSNKKKVEILTYAHRQDRANIAQDIEVLQQRKTQAVQAQDIQTAQQIEAEQNELVKKSNNIFAEQQDLLLKNPDVAQKILDQQKAAQKQADLNERAAQANRAGGFTAFKQQASEVKDRALNALSSGTGSFLTSIDKTLSKPTAQYLFGQEGNNYATDFIHKVVDDIAIPVANIPVYDDKKKEYNFWRFAPNIAESVVTMTMLAAGAKGVSAGTGISTTRASQIIGSMLYFDSSLRDGYEAGMDDATATAYAALTAGIQGVMEGFMPDAKVVFGSKSLAKQFAIDFLKDRNLAVKSLKKKGTQLLAEHIEEFGQNAAQKFGNYLTNTALNTDLDDKLSWEEIVNTALLTTPTVMLMGAGGHVFNHTKESKRQVALLSLYPEESLKVVEELEKTGQFKPENVQELKRQVTQYAQVLKKMPPELDEEKKIAVAPLAVEREELVEQNKEVIPPLQAIAKEKIAALDEQILKVAAPELAKEQESKPAAEKAPAPEPVKTQPVSNVKEETNQGQEGNVLTIPKAMDASLKEEQGIHYVESNGVGMEFEKHKDGIRLSSLKSESKGKGNASKALKEATKYADENKVPIYLDADAKKGGLPQEELVNFYKRNGFVFEGTEGVRQPIPELSQEEKAATNKEAEALGFENVPQALNSIAKRTGQYYTSWAQVPEEVKTQVSQERQAETPPVLPGTSSKLDAAKAKLKAAKEARDKVKSKLGITPDQKAKAKADFEVHKAYVEVAKEFIAAGAKTVQEFVENIGEQLSQNIQDAWDEAMGGKTKSEEDFVEKENFPKKNGEKEQKLEKKGKFSQEKEEVPREKSRGKGRKVDKKGETSPERPKRRFTQQVLNSEDTPEGLKESITDDQVHYNQLPNKLTLEEANFILDRGENAALAAFTDYSNGMSDAVRFTLGSLLLKRLQQYGEYDEALAVLDQITKQATKAGQGIQALAMFQFLTPAGQLRNAEREVSKQRDLRARRDKKKTRKIINGLKKANKESADEALETPEVKKKIEKILKITPQAPETKSYGASNKVVTKDRYNDLLSKVRGNLFLNPLRPEVIEIAAYHLEASGRKFGDFSKNMIRDFGGKVKPYLKEIYDAAKKKLGNEYEDFDPDASVNEEFAKMQTEPLVKAMEKAIAKKNKKDIDRALAALQQASKEQGLWGKYKDYAVARLKNLSPKQIGDDINTSAALKEFTDGLVKNISGMVPEGEKSAPAKPRPPIEIIGDAYKNFEKYEHVWVDTMEQLQEKHKDSPMLAELDAYFGEVLKKPFSDKLLQQSVKEGMKDLGQDLKKLVQSHYSDQEQAAAELADRLIKQAGLDPKDAEELGNAIEKEFERIATKKKQEILANMFSPKERKKPEVKTLESELIRLTNLGAFSDAKILQQYAEKMGYPKLTPENIDRITRLAEKVEEAPEGIKKFRAIEDLLTYQQSIKGVSAWDTSLSLWYASILSGHQTQITNAVASAFNTGVLYIGGSLRNPKNSLKMAEGWWNGMVRGLSEGKEVLRTGYNPIRENKVEVPPVLEWKKFMGGKFNPANYAKYVRRLMVATDTVFFEGLKEMRAYQMAHKEAAAQGKLEPDMNQKNRALELLNKTSNAREAAMAQAESEFKRDSDAINNNPDLSEKEKVVKLAQAKRDIPRRANELIEKGRSESLRKDSHNFAARGTLNYPPEGTLGYISEMMNRIGEKVPPFKLIVPFTNIIANAANTAIDYTPYGALRAKVGGSVLDYVKSKGVPGEMTDQEKVDTMVKAFMGTAIMTAMIVMSQGGDDDEPMIEVTANGYGDYRQNYDLRNAEGKWQPYSFRIKNPLTGKYGPWISYRLTPLVLGLSFVGNIRDYEKYRKGKATDKGFLTKMSIAAGQTVPTFLDMTFLSSASAFLKAISDVNSETVSEDATKAVGRTLKSFAIPNAYTQAAKEFQDWMDISEKEVGAKERGIVGMMEQIAGEFVRDIPAARDLYYNKINGLGEEVIPETSRLISGGETSPEWDLLAQKKATTTVPSIKTVTVWEGDKERFLTRQEYFDFTKKRGELMKQELTNNLERFSQFTEEQFAKEWTDIKGYATSAAKEYVLDKSYSPGPRPLVKHLTPEQQAQKRRKARIKARKR